MSQINAQNNYGAENISVLEGLEAVRKRPGMYIGNTGIEGLNRCLGEVLDNSVDEFMAGHAQKIKVVLLKNGGIMVSDDGRGIPTDIHPKTGKTALETIMTVLHAGGKFDQKNYQFSGGLHGVGASVVNALSEEMGVWVLRDKKVCYLKFSKGKTIGEMQIFEEDLLASKFPEIVEHLVWKTSGTLTYFLPDFSIFEKVNFNPNQIHDSLKQNAYLNKGLELVFADYTGQESVEKVFCFPEGIKTYLEDITQDQELTTPIVQIEGEMENFHLELCLVYTKDFSEKFFAFTNGIYNAEGGMHVTGFRTSFTRLINNYAHQKKFFKKETEKFSAEDLKEGLRCVLSVKMADPQFTSQSKVKLGSTIARTYTDRMVTDKLSTFLEENPKVAQQIITKAQLAMKARLAARAARDNILRKGVLESTSLPGKLADCSEKKPEKSEIFIVEGDSAGGSAKQGRDRHTQAILPLRGKVLNTEKASLEKILNYEGLKNMLIAFGTGIGETFDLSKLRYHKIIIMTDADVDGAHITTLILTFLYRYMNQLIQNGFIYMARPPLYKVQWAKKKFEYVYTDQEKNALVEKVKSENLDKPPAINIQRYKGLGEMNPEQLWETTMDPKKRMLWQVTIGEAEQADKVFTELMGSEVGPRREFIEKNAAYAEPDKH